MNKQCGLHSYRGMAINIHGFARNTEDIDLFINPIEKNVNNLRIAMINVFQDDDIHEITGEELGKYAVIRYGTEDDFLHRHYFKNRRKVFF